MSEHFTKEELLLMRGKYASLARKYNSTTTYVKMIATGERQLNTKLAKMIFEDIHKIIQLFQPLSNEKLLKLKKKLDV